jgi:putative PIN family toxin of toxin-antitoxin system
LRVYLDTNVIVSAFATRGLSSEVFKIVLAEHQLVLSTIVLEDVQKVLTEKIKLPPSQIKEITDFLKNFEVISDFEINESLRLRDSDDIPILSAALSGQVEILVTGDKDLLVVNERYGLRIVTPREFLKLIKGK